MKTIGPEISSSIDTVVNGTKEQIKEIVKMSKDHETLSDEQKNKLISVNSEVKEQSEKNKNEITKFIESAKNHTKLFAATLKSSKFKICEDFERQKKVATATFTNIKSAIVEGGQNMKASSTDIASDIECSDKNLKEDAKESLSFKNNFLSIVHKFGESSKEKLDICRKNVIDFRKKDLKIYSSSGEYTVVFRSKKPSSQFSSLILSPRALIPSAKHIFV